MDKQLTNEDILKLIAKQWANKEDIKKLACVGNNKAYDIIKNIKLELVEKGYTLPRGLVPMEMLIKYLKINIDYHLNLSNKLKGIKQ